MYEQRELEIIVRFWSKMSMKMAKMTKMATWVLMFEAKIVMAEVVAVLRMLRQVRGIDRTHVQVG